MKIVTVLGARPQFVKAATLSRRFASRKKIREIIVHTGQHYDINMSDIFFEEMEIPRPSYQLEIASKMHGEMTGRMLQEIEKTLVKERPDLVLVYGDTNSTLAGALAAAKLHIPVAHVEAGLRSFNRKMPEEVNRILTDHMASYLFTPTETAFGNLVHEGIDKKKIFSFGDVMYDGVLFYGEIAEKKSRLLDTLNLRAKPFLLATIHRQENTNAPERLNLIFDQLSHLAKDKTVVLPLHPRTKGYLKKEYASPNFKIIDPIGYFDMIALQKNCRLIATDSGGMQKEAFFQRKYCVTLRDETEWVELIENRFNFLTKPLDMLSELVENLWEKNFPSQVVNLYGDGHAADKITKLLEGTD